MRERERDERERESDVYFVGRGQKKHVIRNLYFFPILGNRVVNFKFCYV